MLIKFVNNNKRYLNHIKIITNPLVLEVRQGRSTEKNYHFCIFHTLNFFNIHYFYLWLIRCRKIYKISCWFMAIKEMLYSNNLQCTLCSVSASASSSISAKNFLFFVKHVRITTKIGQQLVRHHAFPAFGYSLSQTKSLFFHR